VTAGSRPTTPKHATRAARRRGERSATEEEAIRCAGEEGGFTGPERLAVKGNGVGSGTAANAHPQEFGVVRFIFLANIMEVAAAVVEKWRRRVLRSGR